MPYEKALVKRLTGRPFQLLGVYGREGDPGEIAARMRREGLNWRNGLDLGEPADGVLWARWAPRGFPQLYLLDAEGVIRRRWFGSPGEHVLDREVEAALRELESSR